MADAKNVESGGTHGADKATAMELMKKVDMAMYAAKKVVAELVLFL